MHCVLVRSASVLGPSQGWQLVFISPVVVNECPSCRITYAVMFQVIFFDSFFSLERPRRKLWAPSQRSHVDETKLWSGLACYHWLCFTLQMKNTLTKESLGRNTCKASLCADRVMKMKPRFVWLAALLTEHHVNKWKVSIRCGIFQWTQKVRLCASRLKGSDLEFIRTWFSTPPPRDRDSVFTHSVVGVFAEHGYQVIMGSMSWLANGTSLSLAIPSLERIGHTVLQ